ncbi:hypothetical protein [Azospirillum halopraeferens]|uniref:hypothetical protein n=1 Tax=Azospirillum halopraeferens TaxID=34010 RepID=UPI0003FE3134|nr:hypothetical protein [Azospirillum halopraeferens]
MASKTVKLSDRGSYREVDLDSLPRSVRSAVSDMVKGTPTADVMIDQMGVLYRIHLSEPANTYLDVLSVA